LSPLDRCCQNFFEGGEIAIMLKDLALRICAIEDVINVSSGGGSMRATHGEPL
jgi:hypothetical protein